MSEPLRVDLGAVPALVDLVRSELENPSARLLVQGTPGSGRRTVASDLHGDGAIVVELPRRSPDALLSGLLQAGAALGWVLPAWSDPAESARELSKQLAAQSRTLVILTERLWWMERSSPDASPEDPIAAEHARAVFDAWTSAPGLKVVVLARHSPSAPSTFTRLTLPRAEVHRRELDRPGVWDGYAAAARKLGSVMACNARISPLVMRLGVGVVALDPSLAHEVAQLVGSGEPYITLTQRLVDRAGLVRGLVPALRSLLLSRTSAPQQRVVEACRVPEEHTALLTRCVSYGDAELRVSPTIAAALTEALAKAPTPEPFDEQAAHARWADVRRALDGATDPAALPAPQVVQWMEKVHHLARAGVHGGDEWSRQHIVHRDLIWDRARALSKSGAYAEAASLYHVCLSRQRPEVAARDDYSWHYLGYNLDRAALPGAEEALDKARALAPANPWWNSRRVTYLIERGRIRDADLAWSQAVDAIDPDGEAVVERPELAIQLHRWVATAWLDAGEIKRARSVLDRVPEAALGDDRWRPLEHRLVDAEEAIRLGEVVRPNGMPIEDRWEPVFLPDDDGEAPRRAWYPARVRHETADEVELVVGIPHEDPHQRYIVEKSMTRSEWDEATRLPPRQDMFIEVGEYGEKVIIVPVPQKWSRTMAIDEASLRYLRS